MNVLRLNTWRCAVNKALPTLGVNTRWYSGVNTRVGVNTGCENTHKSNDFALNPFPALVEYTQLGSYAPAPGLICK